MTYVVILEFEDEAQAKTLVEDMLSYPTSAILTPCQENDVYAKPVGAYKKPDNYCRCSELGIRSATRGYTRGLVFGWYVCSTCKKVSPQVYHFFSQLGPINLIPQEVRAKQGEIFVNPVQTERSKYEWSFLNVSL